MITAKIRWVDSVSEHGWVRGTDNKPSEIVSVGVVIADDDTAITIATSISDNGRCCDPLTIPKCAILAVDQKEEKNDVASTGSTGGRAVHQGPGRGGQIRAGQGFGRKAKGRVK